MKKIQGLQAPRRSYIIYLLLFAENFLMLPTDYLTFMRILQGTVSTYLIIHRHLQSIFTTYLTYMHIGKAFLLPILTPFWLAFLPYVHILFTYMYISLRVNFMLYIHTYLHSSEKQIHITYSRIYTFVGKTVSMLCPLEWQFPYYLFTYVRFTWKAFSSCYLSYIHMYMVKNIFTPSQYKEKHHGAA